MADTTITGELKEGSAGGLDHLLIYVSDLEKSKQFYLKALAPLGYVQIVEMPEAKMVGLGAGGKPDFFLCGGGEGPTTKFHLAFRGSSDAAVDEFHANALEAGGKDNGPPGKRPYHPNYYGAFVHDPDGINVEVVHHGSGL